jgi:polar amino acid transport system substrate-binding protein
MIQKILFIAVYFIFNVNNSFSQNYSIGVEQLNYIPHYTYNGDQYLGFARELIDNFAKYAKITITYKILPIKKLFSDFVNGDIDFKYPDSPYWQQNLKKNKKIIYSNSVVKYIDGVLVLPENKNININKLKNLGIVRGFTAWDYLDQIKNNTIKISEHKSLSGLIKMTLKKRIDGLYANVAVAKYQLEQILKQPTGLVFNSSLPHTKSSYFLSTIKHPKMINILNKFLLEKKEKINEIKEKYKILNF